MISIHDFLLNEHHIRYRCPYLAGKIRLDYNFIIFVCRTKTP